MIRYKHIKKEFEIKLEKTGEIILWHRMKQKKE